MKKSRKILIGILICVIIGSVFYIGYYYVTQNKNEKVYKKLQKEVVKQESKEEEPQTEESHVEIPIDFAQLQDQNPDIYAWIQIDGTNINYPVAQSAADNEYYLKHTFEGNYNAAGSIFIDYTNNSNFEDCNTIIYGHNMKNGSMFGLLRKHFKDQESVPGRYIWICTPDKNYRYEIFSSHVVDAAGEVYTLFSAPDEQFASYLEKMKSQSLVDFQTEVTAEDKVITLSTCTGNDATRFVVQAKREGTY